MIHVLYSGQYNLPLTNINPNRGVIQLIERNDIRKLQLVYLNLDARVYRILTSIDHASYDYEIARHKLIAFCILKRIPLAQFNISSWKVYLCFPDMVEI